MFMFMFISMFLDQFFLYYVISKSGKAIKASSFCQVVIAAISNKTFFWYGSEYSLKSEDLLEVCGKSLIAAVRQ